MNRVINSRGLWVSGGLVLLLAGCDGNTSQRPPAEQLTEGLNLLQVKDPSWGFNAAYMKAGRVIYIESRVGASKPDIYKATWPDDPANEMDMRFIDQEGRSFFIVRGGDEFVDPTWKEDMLSANRAAPKIDLLQREADFGIAQEAATAIHVALPASFKDHAFHMQGIAAQPIPTQNPVIMEALMKHPMVVNQTGEISYANGSFSGASTAYLYSSSCCGGFGMHSATNMVSGGNTQLWACNHGRCPDQLGYVSYTNSHYSGNVSLTGETNVNNLATSGGCNGGYSWNTFSQSGCHVWSCSSKGYHECNDDAEYEQLEVYYLGACSGGNGPATCYGDYNSFAYPDRNNDGNTRFMCQCSGSGDNGGCNGDWSTPWYFN
jgi:hypothetical protein